MKWTDEQKNRAIELKFKDGYSWYELADILKNEYFVNETTAKIMQQARTFIRKTAEYKNQNDHYLKPTEAKIIKDEWTGNEIIRFAVMGDTQINSKYTQLTHLHNFYDICEIEGIETVYHTGDMDEGEEMRMGHKYECYNQGVDDHIDEIVKVYPKRQGITTKFITGNHDASIYRRAGFDIGNVIASRRPDMEYLGASHAIIYLTPKCTLELRHPIDGTAYALSYKIQKMVEAFSGGEKPNILAVGHYHKAEYFVYRNVHCIQSGCFQGQTPFTRGKGISIQMGGWICEVQVDKKGTIKRFKSEFVPYYDGIKDDWKKFKRSGI